MKTILRLAMFAYPSEWRARYGGELECLLEDAKSGWRDVFNVIRGGMAMRYTGGNIVRTATTWGITFGLLGLLLSGLFALSMPDLYRGDLLLVVQNRNGLAKLDDLSRMVGLLNDRQFERVVTAYDVYRFDDDMPSIPMLRRPPELLLNQRVVLCKKDLQVTALRNGMVHVSYQSHKPAIASQLTNQFGSLLIEANLAMKTDLRITILNPARIPEKPFRPNRTVIVMDGLVGGMILGAMIALLRRRPPVQLAS